MFQQDHGTCHHRQAVSACLSSCLSSLLGPDGSAVSVTASVNLLWGCKYMSPHTGVVMNNQMNDFASPGVTSAYGVPPFPNNLIAPGLRPLSSMSGTIVVDPRGRVVAVAGGSGGTKIITATAQVLLRALYLGQSVKEAVDARRLHHQLAPMVLGHEQGVTYWLLEGLRATGHNVTRYRGGGSAVQVRLFPR